MRHRKHKLVLDRTAKQRRALLRNLAASIILHEHVVTTRGKAKAVAPLVERLIRIGTQTTIAHRRQLLAALPDPSAANKILEVLGPRYHQRTGGYLRVIRLNTRAGDGAQLARVELV